MVSSMTNEELLQDLKQFVTATVSQATASLATKDDIVRLEARIGEVQEELSGVAGMVEDMHKKHEDLIEKVNEHDVRIGRLEHKLA